MKNELCELGSAGFHPAGSGILPGPSLISVPLHEKSTFHRLPNPVQNHLELWRGRVNEVFCREGAIGTKNALKEVAARHNTTYGTLRDWFYSARKHGWRGLINGQLLGDNKSNVAPEFIPYWHGLVFQNQRNTDRAYSRFIAAYRAGDPIPGLPPAGMREAKPPLGFGKRNLCRKKYMPRKASIALARRGVAEARKFLPTGEQDLSHIRPLEYILFDDVELDFLIAVPESATPVKLRLIVAMDLCSRVILGYGIRPGLVRADGVEDGLKLVDMKMVVARLLRTWGVPLDYQMHFICERGTAALPDAAKTALAEISGGQIRVHDTSMVVGQVFEFRDKSTGNSWGKAWLESLFNPFHGELAHAPGQKGLRYDRAPAELDGRRKELAALIRAGQRLPVDLRYQFKLPFLSPAEAVQEIDSALARLHARRDHQLNSFEIAKLWRIAPNDPWKSVTELPDILLDRLDQLEWNHREMESPLERFQRLLPLAERRAEIPDSSLQLLMEEHARVRFADLSFAFEYKRTDYVYLPPDSLLPLLTEGQHYLLWFHPQEMGVVYVTRDRPHLGYVGKLTRFTAGRRGDLEDAKNYLREKQRLFNHALAQAQGPAVDRLRHRAEELDQNTTLINEALRTHEVEIEVVAARPPAEAEEGNRGGWRAGEPRIDQSGEAAISPPSLAAMHADRAETAANRAAAKSVDLVAETINRPRVQKPDAADAWA